MADRHASRPDAPRKRSWIGKYKDTSSASLPTPQEGQELSYNRPPRAGNSGLPSASSTPTSSTSGLPFKRSGSSTSLDSSSSRPTTPTYKRWNSTTSSSLTKTSELDQQASKIVLNAIDRERSASNSPQLSKKDLNTDSTRSSSGFSRMSLASVVGGLSALSLNRSREDRGRSATTKDKDRAPRPEPVAVHIRRSRTRDSSPTVEALTQSDVESDVEVNRIRPRNAFSAAQSDEYSPEGSDDEEESDEESWSEGEQFDPLTEQNTERNALVPADRVENDTVDIPDPLGEGVNVIIPPDALLPFYPQHEYTPVFQRDRCTITVTHGDPDKILEETGRRPKRYVLASDLSEESRYALEWGIGTVMRDGDEMLMVTVIENEDKVDPLIPNPADRMAKLRCQQERQGMAYILVRQATSLLQRTNLNVTIACQAWHAKNARHMLLDIVDYIEPVMLIVGSRGLGNLKGYRILLGSTSHYLIQAKMLCTRDGRPPQAEAESTHRQALEDADHARQELQESLKEAVEKLDLRTKVEGDLETMQTRYEEEVDSLKERLHSAEKELEQLKKARDDSLAEHARVVEELEQRREEVRCTLSDKETTDAALSELRMRLEGEAKILEAKVEALETEREELKRQYNDLEVSKDQVSHDREELEEELKKANIDLDLLRLELKSEVECRSQQAATDAEALEAATSRVAQAEATCVELREHISELETKLAEAETTLRTVSVQAGSASELQQRLANLQQELHEARSQLNDKQEQAHRVSKESADLRDETTGLRTKLEETEVALQALREEEQRLHMELTPLQAEVQKLLSERRFLENSVQSSQSEAQALKKQIEDTRATQVEWEKAAKSAEVKLDLQVAQHNKTVASLRKELVALQETVKLEDTVADLQGKNAEMEELLKAKCQEIEENDDRFIKFLKEEKKLTSKVEFLTRKVKTLQDKLAATSSDDSTPTAVPLSAASTSSKAGPSRPSAVAHPPPPTRSDSLRSLRCRTFLQLHQAPACDQTRRHLSQPSPEDRIPQPVFRPRTPEARHTTTLPDFTQPLPSFQQPPVLQGAFTMSTSTSTSSSIGKKRRAPDDFDGLRQCTSTDIYGRQRAA
ncbi:hypothetical protein NM688_g2563 [Phlebia brevispora]|uniref:Uncharacterized protein n=1 Tax=Phlebia brevispora TaxID=194682 RepID=A0ACC1T7Z9_9APHY|nr:hypothetical protein NM688_g2563 [Phlebia brevispora]